jgi:undecaprenyl-diphosphatase
MEIWQAIVLGIVQGLTEFLPVSSTAHLRITPDLLKFQDPGAGFTAIIQLGTLAAVIWYFWSDILLLSRAWITGIVKRQPFATWESRQGWYIIFATIPIVVCGLAFKVWIKGPLRELPIVALQLLAGSVLMIVAEWVNRVRQTTGTKIADLSFRQVLGTGFFQALALLPGMSRSGSTMSGGMLLGMSRETAARFSFLLSLPAITAAGLYSLWDDAIQPWMKNEQSIIQTPGMIINLVIATLVSAIVGYAAIVLMLRYLRTHTMAVFIVYRVLLATLLLYFCW